MKNTGKIFGIIAFVAVILFMAACATSTPGGTSTPDGTSTPGGTSTPSATTAPSGTYRLTTDSSWTITFASGNFTMFVPAKDSPTGKDSILNGTYTISGRTVTVLLTGSNQAETFTITDSVTITDNDDGSVWRKQ